MFTGTRLFSASLNSTVLADTEEGCNGSLKTAVTVRLRETPVASGTGLYYVIQGGLESGNVKKVSE